MATVMSEVRDGVRLLLSHTSAVVPDFTDADLLTHINMAHTWWFDNMEKRVRGVTLAATLAAGTYVKALDSTTVYPEFVEVTVTGVIVGDPIVPLVEMPWSELRNRQQANGTQAQPLYYAARRLEGASPTATLQNRWEMAFFPIPDATYTVKGLVRDYPTALANNGDVLYVGDFEARVCITCYAAILAAEGAGRPDLAEDLMGILPQAARDRLMAHSSHEEIMS